ncbi:SIR2 family protein [Patulibacter minatonensis]|uniref:SIR2 family protein n=1 Tax=Patulibacter minatonensis TaxID=298163 RepID=UPI0006873EE1|nr:SIR2 family protein [Patulibacter minatonensis]
MSPGRHLFVTRGDLTALHCDAWVLPTDREGTVTAPWVPELERLGRGEADAYGGRLDEAARRDLEATGAAVLRAPTRTLPGVVACDTAVAHGDVGACAAAASTAIGHVTALVASAGALPTGALELPRPRTLVGLPTVGVGAGGGRDVRGAVLAGQIDAARATLAAGDGPDVVLVCFDHEHYAAAQRARRAAGVGAELAAVLGDDLHGRVEALAAHARAGRLVPFVGAGVSMGAGLPSWVGLLDELISEAGMEADRAALDRVDLRDRAALIQSRLGAGELERILLERLTAASRVALQHQLLASLPVHEAASTNWDDLFERAWVDAGAGRVAQLPFDGQTGADHWIVKLHGTVRQGKLHGVVLTRDDYLRFGAERNALAGIVQSLLLTRHMLFVGFGLSDETFHRIAHDVRQVLADGTGIPERQGAYATSLSPSRHSVTAELWKGQLDVVSTRRAADGEGRAGTAPAARRLEIALDLLGMLSVDPLGHLLDPSFDGALTAEERRLAEALRRFADTAGPLLHDAGPAGDAVGRWLDRMRER